jgi:hypothetical protein
VGGIVKFDNVTTMFEGMVSPVENDIRKEQSLSEASVVMEEHVDV